MKNFGSVITIINEYRVAIDLGSSVVSVGDKVAIVDNDIEIKDLEGKKLGVFSFEKALLEVVEVYDKFSICFTADTVQSQNIFTMVGQSTIGKEVPKKLNVDPEMNLNAKLENSTIKIGDKVIVKKY